ncbi:DNA -binding domain-containing protein [Novosphingobium cyanobacteriorum]|uniref:DNA -binding domain-containing protein n=1 Tax=Novosphingobium cyanobacteriorum TaxID=3024215 RepID=UPI0034D96899
MSPRTQILFRTDSMDRARWQDASARHAIKSLLRDARALISGGYLRLLRHRRRS